MFAILLAKKIRRTSTRSAAMGVARKKLETGKSKMRKNLRELAG